MRAPDKILPNDANDLMFLHGLHLLLEAAFECLSARDALARVRHRLNAGCLDVVAAVLAFRRLGKPPSPSGLDRGRG